MNKTPAPPPDRFKLSEDWLAVLLAFIIMLLAATQILGPGGISITF